MNSLFNPESPQNVDSYPQKRVRGGSVNEVVIRQQKSHCRNPVEEVVQGLPSEPLAPSEPQSDRSGPQARLTRTVTDWQNSLPALASLLGQSSPATQLDAKLLGLHEAQPETSAHCLPHENDTTEHLNYFISLSHESAPRFSEPLSPRTTLLPGPSLPLTRENLCQLSGGMSNPMTPEATDSESTTPKTNSSASLKVGLVRQLLELNNMLFDDHFAMGNASAKTFAESIVMCPRDSPDRPHAGQGLAGLLRRYSRHNESTLMHQWFHRLVKNDRRPNQKLPYQGAGAVDGDDEDVEEFIDADGSASVLNEDGVWRLFQADGLESCWNNEFCCNSIPQLEKRALAAMLEDLPRIVNPKPAITYGYDNDWFTEEQQALNVRYSPVGKISDSINWPFFIVEAKLDAFDAVQNQCICSGSALVHSVRRLLEEHDVSVRDISDESAVFSLAITTESAYIYVHWAEKRVDGTMAYHMKTVTGFLLGLEQAHMDLRKAINNILDWGLLRRKSKINKILEAILAKTESGKREAPSSPSAETSSKQAKTQRS